MTVWGKILGAFFGYLLGGPIGLALGIFLGHKFDKARQNLLYQTDGTQHARQQAYFHATFAVMGHLAKAKGKVTEQEIRLASTLMDRMNLTGQARRDAQEAFREGKDPSFPLQQVLMDVRRNCRGRQDLLRFFVEVQIHAALADQDIHPAEYQVLVSVAQGLGFSRYQLDQQLAMQQAAYQFDQQHGQASQTERLQQAYKVLSIDEGTPMKEIKRAYRKLMNEHHPDKLAATGLPPEMMEMAKQKAQEIQAAYDLIKKHKDSQV